MTSKEGESKYTNRCMWTTAKSPRPLLLISMRLPTAFARAFPLRNTNKTNCLKEFLLRLSQRKRVVFVLRLEALVKAAISMTSQVRPLHATLDMPDSILCMPDTSS